MRLSHVKNHYTSEGQKTVTKRKVHKNGNWVEEISYYLGNVALKDGHFHALMHAEGRLMKDHNGEMHQEYFIKDHLGNVRVRFEDINGDGEIQYEFPVDNEYEESELITSHHYYPFGMEWKGTFYYDNNKEIQRKRYNGKEYESGIGLLDYGARWYDPVIGRWDVVDPLADAAPGWTPYRYAFDNPINFYDPDGLFEDRDAAKAYAKENDIRTGWFSSSKIKEQDDGTYAIVNRKSNSITQDFGGDIGVATGVIKTAPKKVVPTISEKTPNMFENLNNDFGFFGSFTYGVLNDTWITLQKLNPIDFQITTLEGNYASKNEQISALAGSAASVAPYARGLKPVMAVTPRGLTIPKLNAAQFSKMFRGTPISSASAPARGKMNRAINKSIERVNKNMETGKSLLLLTPENDKN